MLTVYFHKTIFGEIGIGEENGVITNVYFNKIKIEENVEIAESSIIKAAFYELDKYFSGKLKHFTVPFEPAGSVFMKKVWDCISVIPYGETVSYKQIAVCIGNLGSCRAVGMAANKNPIPIFIPCHRVIGSNGMLCGYNGGIGLKKSLIDLENSCK